MKQQSRKSSEKLTPIAGAARASHQPTPQPQPRHVTVRQEQVTTIFDPEVLRKYQGMVPDAPERVLRVFELNSAHERETTAAALQAQIADNRRRDWMAFLLIAFGLLLSALFAYLGRPFLSGGTLVGVAGYVAWGFLVKRGKSPNGDASR